MGITEEAGYLCQVGACGYWLFLGRMGISVQAGHVDHGMGWDGLFLKYGYLGEIGFWSTGWIMGGLLGFPSEQRMVCMRAGQSEKRYLDDGLGLAS